MSESVQNDVDTNKLVKLLDREVASIKTTLAVPENLQKEKLVLVHEVGHAAVVLANERSILGYHVGPLSWWEAEVSPVIIEPGTKGAIMWDSEGVRRGEAVAKEVAAGGAASEMLHFGHIESTARMQQDDRQIGSFTNFSEVQKVAEGIADRFEQDLSSLYSLVWNRICASKGFSDINDALRRGSRIRQLMRIV